MEFASSKIVVFVPESHAEAVRACLTEQGCGKLGDYDSCSFSTKGIGRFRPLRGAKPHIGEIGKLEKVAEERIETLCATEKLESVIEAVKKVHPYEEPAIEVYPLIFPHRVDK